MQNLGIDIGGTFIKYALTDESCHIIKKWEKPAKLFSSKDDFYDYLCEKIDPSSVRYIGVSAPGIIDKDANVLSKASENIRIMYQTNINREVSLRLNRPTASINDAKAAGFCELKLGNGKGTESSVYWIIGTGIGGCVCSRDSILSGKDNIAGEFSFLPLTIKDNKIVNIGKTASMKALINLYNQRVPEEEKTEYGKEICHRYLSRDPVATDVINEWCQNIVLGLYSVIIFYNPEVICIGGGISEEDWFIEKIRDIYENGVKLHFKDLITTRIERCKFHNDSNILGAV